MIKKAQIKFVTIVMIILFFVFALIFGVYFFIMKNMNENTIEKTLNDMATEITSTNTPPSFTPKNCMWVIFRSTSGLAVTEARYDSETFPASSINGLIRNILSKDTTSGTIGNIYFKYFSKPQQSVNIIVAIDKTESLHDFSAQVVNGGLVIFAIYLIMFFVAWRLSFFVFKPIRESFYKQREFISNASHELKTPLAIVSANADVISASADNNPYLESIKAQTKRMSILVGDMLTLAKMDERENSSDAQTFNLSDEIMSNTLPFDAVAFEKGKTIDVDIEPDIMYKGSLHSVKNIINILMDNAVKHASINGKIVVSLKKENGKIILTVFNTGSKVPNQDSEKIFERFYRPDDSRSRDSGGSGLGLAIAKGIADSNKWRISAKSVLDKSMTISIVF